MLILLLLCKGSFLAGAILERETGRHRDGVRGERELEALSANERKEGEREGFRF